ncbi:MAG: hypothetical protein JEZ03_15650 [Bacteroidales bacterium]|nr:hypothetical protein [Bacteroidales bacterium]
MSDRTIFLTDLDFEYKLWKNRMSYIREENIIYTNRCEELINTNLASEDILNLERLKANFLNQADLVRKIHNRIVVSEREMVYYKFDYPINKRHQHYIDHENLRSEILKIDDNHQKLLNDFKKYLI